MQAKPSNGRCRIHVAVVETPSLLPKIAELTAWLFADPCIADAPDYHCRLRVAPASLPSTLFGEPTERVFGFIRGFRADKLLDGSPALL